MIKKTNIYKGLIPKNPNISRRRSGKREASNIPNETGPSFGLPPELHNFSYVPHSPLENSTEFVKYYHTAIYRSYPGARFEHFVIDARTACDILDRLLDLGHNNMKFLNAWINFYIDHKLKGRKAYSPFYTSMKAFYDTFDQFNSLYKE